MNPSRDLLLTELLVIKYKQGYIESMGELVSIWQTPVYYYIRRLIPSEDEALDVLQEVWLRVIRKIKQLREPSAFPAWLFKIARNTSYTHLRKADRRLATATDEDVLRVTCEENDTSLEDFGPEAVHKGLAELSLAHRECLTLRFIEGFSVMEISDITGAPGGTVKSRLHHAKKSLRETLIRRMKT